MCERVSLMVWHTSFYWSSPCNRDEHAIHQRDGPPRSFSPPFENERHEGSGESKSYFISPEFLLIRKYDQNMNDGVCYD